MSRILKRITTPTSVTESNTTLQHNSRGTSFTSPTDILVIVDGGQTRNKTFMHSLSCPFRRPTHCQDFATAQKFSRRIVTNYYNKHMASADQTHEMLEMMKKQMEQIDILRTKNDELISTNNNSDHQKRPKTKAPD